MTTGFKELRLAIFLSTMAASIALAAPMGPAPAADATDQRTASAKALWQEANAHYAVGEFEAAAEKYQAAYTLKADPALLYNAAQSYRLAGKNEKAVLIYKNYVMFYPSGKNVSNAEQQIMKLQEAIAAQQKAHRQPPTMAEPAEEAATGGTPLHSATTEPAAATPAAPAAVTVTPTALVKSAAAPKSSLSGHGLRTTGIATASDGVAAIIVGAVLSARVRSLSSDVTSAPQFIPDTDASARSAAALQWVFYGLGAAAVGAGAVFFYLDYRRSHAGKSNVALLPMAGSRQPSGACLRVSF